MSCIFLVISSLFTKYLKASLMARWWALNRKDKNRINWPDYYLVGTSISSLLKSPNLVNLISLYSSRSVLSSLFSFKSFLFSVNNFSHLSHSFLSWGVFLYFCADLLITLFSISLDFLFLLMIGVLWISFELLISFSLPSSLPIVFYVLAWLLYPSISFYFSLMVFLALKSILLRFFSFSDGYLSFFRLPSAFLSLELSYKFYFLRVMSFCSRRLGPCSFLW